MILHGDNSFSRDHGSTWQEGGEEREGSSQIRGMGTVSVRVWVGHVENMG